MEIFVLGIASSGKSTFVRNFSDFLREKGYKVATINLDTASDPIYKAEKNVRDFVSAEKIMREFNLGINGALLKSVEIVEENVERLKIKEDCDFLIYDTPGQMELFLYSEAGKNIIKKLSSKKSVIIFLIDSTLAKELHSFISCLLQSVIIYLRFEIPTIPVFSKKDLFDFNVKEKIREVKSKKDALSEILERIIDIIELSILRFREVKVNNLNKEGYEDLFKLLYEIFCICGDLS
ncbi:MAG: ATP/GTP-binding protein [Candidatus Aenigmatarchaeota archaeon]